MGFNQILFAWPARNYMSFIKGAKSADTVNAAHETVVAEIHSCLEGGSQIEKIELGVAGPALDWSINTLLPNSMAGWAVIGQPLKGLGDTDITGVIHNNQAKLNNSILATIDTEKVRVLCENLPDEIYNAEALRANTDYVAEMFDGLKLFYSHAAAHDNAVISYSG